MSLLEYDQIPSDMRVYLQNYGLHFNKKAADFAISLMRKKGNSGALERIIAWSKEDVDAMLKRNAITLENDVLHDSVYVANMAKADYYGSALSDEAHLAKYVKDTIDDVDTEDGSLFVAWYAKTLHNGVPIDWIELL